MPEEKVRIDKWLWAVRIFKTRSLAAEECNQGHVTIGDVHVKPSRELKGGEIVKVRVPPRGWGRPTKRDRRMIDKLKEEDYDEF